MSVTLSSVHSGVAVLRLFSPPKDAKKGAQPLPPRLHPRALRRGAGSSVHSAASRSCTSTSPGGYHVSRLYHVGRWFDTGLQTCRIDVVVSSFKGGPAAAARSNSPKWRNWQTRMVQVHVPARVWGFESLLRHHLLWLAIAVALA